MAKKRIYRFKGTEGGPVDESTVKSWIDRHQQHHEVKGHFFGQEIIQKILNYPGCVGIRIYHAIDDKNQKQLILVGADSKGKDLWPSTSKPKAAKGKFKAADGPGGPVAGDQSYPCPPFCG